MTIKAKRTDEWAEAGRILGSGRKLGLAFRKALFQEAEVLRAKIIANISSGGKPKFAPHSFWTLVVYRAQGKGGTKILIKSGGLIGSIKVVKTGFGVFVGVKRGRGKGKGKGKSTVDIAKIHEEGRAWTQRLTQKQLRFLFAMLKRAGKRPRAGKGGTGSGSTVTIRIPARPFLGPAIKEHTAEPGFSRSIMRRVARMMGGDLGSP